MKRFLNQLGTIVIVTVVTVLVWLYAEDANISEYADQSVRLQFILPEGSEGLIDPSGPITVGVNFDSSNGQYQQFIEKTRGKAIEIDLPFDQSRDLQTIDVDIREQLEQWVFDDLGINVTGVSPDRVPVTFEKIVDVTLDIELVQDTGDIKLSAAQIPNEAERRITLRLPAGQAQRLANASAIVRIRKQDVQDVAKGDSKQLRLPVELPKRLSDLKPLTANAGVLVTVANDRGTVTIDRRAVLLSYPASINQRYVVEIDESARFITGFELEGPREQIELLKADPSSPAVWASVRLTNQEADDAAANGGEITKAVEIIAPPGVVLVSDVVRVTIKVKPRETPAP